MCQSGSVYILGWRVLLPFTVQFFPKPWRLGWSQGQSISLWPRGRTSPYPADQHLGLKAERKVRTSCFPKEGSAEIRHSGNQKNLGQRHGLVGTVLLLLPIRGFFRRGILPQINTDDRDVLNISLGPTKLRVGFFLTLGPHLPFPRAFS